MLRGEFTLIPLNAIHTDSLDNYHFQSIAEKVIAVHAVKIEFADIFEMQLKT